MNITAHTMQYTGGPAEWDGELKQYSDVYFEEYRKLYNDSFQKMRTALKLTPVACCSSRKTLMGKRDQIFLLFEGGRLAGAVSIYEHEIDDLIVGQDFRRKGYGTRLLKFAVNRMQRLEKTPIILHVAGWNQDAVRLYLANGFEITKTELIQKPKTPDGKI